MDVGNATIIAAAIAAAVSLGSSVFAWCAANKSNKAAAQSNEVTNRTNREIAVFEQDEENKRNIVCPKKETCGFVSSPRLISVGSTFLSFIPK